MKKNLIALAVLAASGIASAQSSVTLYGLVDAYVGSSRVKLSSPGVATTSTRQTVVDSGGFNTSRFGLKGSEDLGGGLKANFVLEAGFNVDTGAANSYINPFTGAVSGSTFGRQSWVGMSGGFGEVRVGKMWTPYDEVKGSGAAAFDANIFAPAAGVWASNNYQDRPGNALYYATPSFSGFSAAAMYSLGENKTATSSAGKIASFNVQYAGGPVAAALAYQTEKDGGASLNTNTTKFTQLNGSYDFGPAKLLAAYGHVKDGSDKAKEYQIGVDVPFGAVTLSGGYAHSKITSTAGDVTSKGIGLAAKYDLSKRTFLYTGLQLAKNEIAGSEVKTDTFAVGVQHKF
ncbi:Outer membrane porin protein 32 precursor [Polaromonas sp. CG9_12]|nr:Outer membrane porin protein 32 precursor [Polaromonas sp. CG9_12]